ncbi:MAG: HisA/HisF-related TIM barrel protein [Candidatus Gallimonas sp.]
MILFPAIDILEGRAVRLLYGKKDAVTDYGDPVERAKTWKDAGAKFLHVVDLSGAFGDKSKFNRILEKIARLGVPVQSGGGLRSEPDIRRRFEAGAERVVLGTVCVTRPEVLYAAAEEYGEKIVAGIDVKNGKLAVKGWTETADKDGFDFGCEAKALGLKYAVYTDVGRDGALTGADVEGSARMGETGLRIIASGGIRSLEDLRALQKSGVYGAILGRSIYTGDVDLKKALSETV